MFTLFLTSFVQFFSCLAVIRLFTNIKSKERENLRWITKVN